MERIPQHLCKFRRGTSLRFARWLGDLPGYAEWIHWTDVPHCLVRSGHGEVRLLSAPADGSSPRSLCASRRSSRIRGAAVTPAADALVVSHEHPTGAVLSVHDHHGERASTVYRDRTPDIQLATDGRVVLVAAHEPPHLSTFDRELRERRPWPVEALQRRFDDPCQYVSVIRNLGDAVLIGTAQTWSRWSWDGELLGAWPMPLTTSPRPPQVVHRPYLVAWDDLEPILMAVDPTTWRTDLFGWSLARQEARPLGQLLRWPRAAHSVDRRWLVVDRVAPRGGRRLELWDWQRGHLVERLETRRFAVSALAFAPDGSELAVATGRDLFTLTIEAAAGDELLHRVA
ncbi:MAG TPA: hypothetical protein VK698_14990 [Kofleriaceae bacterium]|nr:hypothetical protein [Kofleriaceae bacterium]